MKNKMSSWPKVALMMRMAECTSYSAVLFIIIKIIEFKKNDNGANSTGAWRCHFVLGTQNLCYTLHKFKNILVQSYGENL